MISNSNNETVPMDADHAEEASPPISLTGRDGAGLVPLCVDLDGTLIRTDTLLEGLIALAGGMRFGAIIGASIRGPAYLKAQVAALAAFDPALLRLTMRRCSTTSGCSAPRVVVSC